MTKHEAMQLLGVTTDAALARALRLQPQAVTNRWPRSGDLLESQAESVRALLRGDPPLSVDDLCLLVRAAAAAGWRLKSVCPDGRDVLLYDRPGRWNPLARTKQARELCERLKIIWPGGSDSDAGRVVVAIAAHP